MFNTKASDLIRQRYSCRTYQKRPVSDQDIKTLEAFMQLLVPGPFGNQPRFLIVPASEHDPRTLPKLGTYGFIKDPAAYIIGAIHDKPTTLVDFGYCMELLILKAVEIGLGSCWLGGTYTKSRFSYQMDLNPAESIPSVTSLGYPSDHKGWLDRTTRVYAGADRRLAWDVLFFTDNWDTPLSEGKAEAFLEPLQLVRLAPSASNKQPWRLLRTGDIWHFYLQRTPNYPTPVFGQLLGIADLQRIDMGIAIAHFDLAVAEKGLSGKWIADDPKLEDLDQPREYILSWLPVSK